MRFTTANKLTQSVQFKKHSLSIPSAEWIPVKAFLNIIGWSKKIVKHIYDLIKLTVYHLKPNHCLFQLKRRHDVT